LNVCRQEGDDFACCLTARPVAEAILKAEGLEATTANAQSIAQAVQHGLKNHEGKGVEIVGEAHPAKWRLHTN
jgi:hypothetical protein